VPTALAKALVDDMMAAMKPKAAKSTQPMLPLTSRDAAKARIS